jgi:antitoxin HigA-1
MAEIPLPHPGVVLREEFLEPMGITAAVALRLGRFFGVDPQWFMNMQAKYDLHVQAERLAAELAAIEPRSAA